MVSEAKIAMNIVGKKAKSEAIKFVVGDLAAKIFSYADLFVGFVDTYSKAVRAENLENVRRNLEICPHIGGCENLRHAQIMAADTCATVWRATDGYYYFHPQLNYRVRHATEIFRTTDDGGWRIEKLGHSEWILEDCRACVEAHAGK